MEALLGLLALFTGAAALLPWWRRDDWWIRIFDFPRLQLAALGVAALLGYRLVESGPPGWAMQAVAALATGWQLWRMHPWTRLGRLQVEAAQPDGTGAGTLRLMVANVLMSNRRSERLLALVRRERPDLLLTVETDRWWEERLRVLEQDYPHTVKQPQANTYGMLLHSRHPLVRPEVRFLVADDVPSIHTAVELPGAPAVRLYCLHPRPPRPSMQQDTTLRDAELVKVGRELHGCDDPAVVAGDLNDVAWSYTTDLFQRLSGLLDPRRGRGMYNTFNAANPLLRFPLDHIFHSAHFRLLRLARLPAFGSDHFPILVELSYERHALLSQPSPEAEPDDHRMAEELLERAREKR